MTEMIRQGLSLKELNPNNKMLVSIDGQEIELNYDAFLEKFGIAGLVRINAGEYGCINMSEGSKFTHFNLKSAKHEKGKKYLIIKVERGGFSETTTEPEKLPLLSFAGARFVTCLDCRNEIPYSELKDHDFANSMTNIRNISELEGVMCSRYCTSRNMTKEQIKSAGVSRTVFEISQEFQQDDLDSLKI